MIEIVPFITLLNRDCTPHTANQLFSPMLHQAASGCYGLAGVMGSMALCGAR